MPSASTIADPTTVLSPPSVLERQGCRLHYWTAGPKTRPWIALTHGFTMDHRLFETQVAVLARDWRVLVWDVRGHGLSKPIGEGFSVGIAAADLLALLDHVGADQAALVGHSMGGYVAQEIEFRYPKRVAALAMISSTCLTFEQPAALTLGAPFTQAALRFCPEDMYHRSVGEIAGVSDSVRAYAEHASRQVSRADRERIWAGILGSYHYEPGYRIRCPLLLMHGDHDYQVAFGLIKLLAPRWIEREVGCRHAIIPRAGHNANQDNPEFVNRMLLEFLREAYPAVPAAVEGAAE
ncbi:MAG: alpha/beta hydrolase [Deltaproteobacteria bacterium]|nr:alpha/beta hydrolase [Deltaproteobacteria bacterium]